MIYQSIDLLKIYGFYLAQLIYQAYFDTCSDSRLSFTDAFKEFIATTVTEWMSGKIQAFQSEYQTWKRFSLCIRCSCYTRFLQELENSC